MKTDEPARPAMQLRPGDPWPIGTMRLVSGKAQPLPARARWTHVQFRRFVGCPICSLHLREFVRRRAELERHDIAEVILFSSTRSVVAEYVDQIPFPMVADPERQFYRRVGVERSLRALASPRTWLKASRALFSVGARLPEHAGDANATPADFLIDASGVVRACQYGRYADDQWTFDQLIELSRSASQPT
jgi:peroxiredoxin